MLEKECGKIEPLQAAIMAGPSAEEGWIKAVKISQIW